MIERERWNRCRIVEGDARGHYESYFQRANHPKRPLRSGFVMPCFRSRDEPATRGGQGVYCFFVGLAASNRTRGTFRV